MISLLSNGTRCLFDILDASILLLSVFTMSSHVALQVEIRVEHPWTMRTSESFHSAVNFDVFVQIRSLSEAESTIWEGAAVGSFIGMNPQMIEEIVPLSKVLSTVFMVTLQNLDISF